MLSKDGAQPILSLQILPSTDEKYFPFDRGSVCWEISNSSFTDEISNKRNL